MFSFSPLFKKKKKTDSTQQINIEYKAESFTSHQKPCPFKIIKLQKD